MSALWDWLTGKSEAEGAALDARLDELNQRAAPIYGEEWAREVETNRGRSSRAEDYDAQIYEEFTPEALGNNLKESAATAGNAVGSAVGSVANAAGSFFGRVLLGVPLWLWLLALGIGAAWLGWPAIVARLARRK